MRGMKKLLSGLSAIAHPYWILSCVDVTVLLTFFLFLFPCRALYAESSSSLSANWIGKVTDRSVSGLPGLSENVWILSRPPYKQYDSIALHRITKDEHRPDAPHPVFLFFPGAHLHGEVVLADERYDLRLYLANRGVETWTLDYRTHTLPRDQIRDSRFMQPWTTEAFIEDAAVAADFVRKTSGQQFIFVGGFGRGATFAALMSARYGRADVSGLILLDGYVLEPSDEEPLYQERQETPEWFADDLEGRYLPYPRWLKQLQDILADPSGPDFLPVHIFANRTEALAHFLYVSPAFGQQGGLSNAKEGYADILVLARLLLNEDRYWPRVQNHGGFNFKRHLAGSRFDYGKALTTMNIPIFAFASGNMDKAEIPWAERIEYTARATATHDVQYRLLENWGHLDMLFGTKARQEVFQPLVDWISQRQKSREGKDASAERQ